MNYRRLCFLSAALLCLPLAAKDISRTLSPEQKSWVAQGRRFDRAGWVYLHVEGEPRARGFQHGYLLAHEIADGLKSTQSAWAHETAMDWPWLVKQSAPMFMAKIDPENMAELQGIAEGSVAAGVPTTLAEIVAYNAILELQGYWWPLEAKKLKDEKPSIGPRQSCSSFIATGSFTRDGNVVLGHNTMQSYNDALPMVIEDIQPAKGHRILWQTCPGWIHSGSDFFITDGGLVGSETTIGQFEGFDTNGVPEFTRMRRATQDATDIESWCATMRAGNNGGYANAWLLGDINSHEIARLELGLKYVGYEKKRNGYFVGSNVAEDRKLLKLETSRDELDIRLSSVARRVRWKQLMKQNAGKINVDLARKFEADHYDAYRGKVYPGGRTLCGHFDLDGDASGSSHEIPFECSGTVDGKVVDATMAKQMSFSARFGSACGKPFHAAKFLEAHPQFEWLTGLIKDRPSRPWVVFKAGE
jgi:hypothetical protein